MSKQRELKIRVPSRCQDGHFAFRYMIITTTSIENQWGRLDDRCRSSHEGYYQSIGDLQQFTGMLDKNGIEIYEGDIIQNTYQVARLNKLKQMIGYTTHKETVVVKWDEHWCHFTFTGQPVRGEFEVIGNTHENPELVEGTC